MSEYFPPYVVSTNNNIKVVLDLSGYAKEDDLAYFRDKDYIEQIYLVFEPKYEYFKTFDTENFTYVSSWESTGTSNEKIISTKTISYDSSPSLSDSDGGKIVLIFYDDYLKQQDLALYGY